MKHTEYKRGFADGNNPRWDLRYNPPPVHHESEFAAYDKGFAEAATKHGAVFAPRTGR